VIRYLDSSAVLAWLLDEPAAVVVAEVLERSTGVLVSDLTMVETDRTLHRLAAQDAIRVAGIDQLRIRFREAFATWTSIPIGAGVVERARGSFPGDHIRSLDAIHLASALVARDNVGELELVSLDGRIRANGSALGFRVLPA
jgi:predicted nucleic acid-binding protein